MLLNFQSSFIKNEDVIKLFKIVIYEGLERGGSEGVKQPAGAPYGL
jgi:hypothetical protein